MDQKRNPPAITDKRSSMLACGQQCCRDACYPQHFVEISLNRPSAQHKGFVLEIKTSSGATTFLHSSNNSAGCLQIYALQHTTSQKHRCGERYGTLTLHCCLPNTPARGGGRLPPPTQIENWRHGLSISMITLSRTIDCCRCCWCTCWSTQGRCSSIRQWHETGL